VYIIFFFFFFQAEDGIRDIGVTGVQTCALPIFHAWSFDSEGNCVGLPREKAGYCSNGDCSITRDDLGLREVKTQVGYGGFVYVNLDDGCAPLEDHIGPTLDTIIEDRKSKRLNSSHANIPYAVFCLKKNKWTMSTTMTIG